MVMEKMKIFNIPLIQCEEAIVTVLVTLDSVQCCGSIEYKSGKRDGETTLFGSTEIDIADQVGLV